MNDLENLWQENGKIDKNKKPTVVLYAPVEKQTKQLNNRDINLKLTDEVKFSMTQFDKVNKGLANANINCFMNVSL